MMTSVRTYLHRQVSGFLVPSIVLVTIGQVRTGWDRVGRRWVPIDWLVVVGGWLVSPLVSSAKVNCSKLSSTWFRSCNGSLLSSCFKRFDWGPCRDNDSWVGWTWVKGVPRLDLVKGHLCWSKPLLLKLQFFENQYPHMSAASHKKYGSLRGNQVYVCPMD